LYDWGNSAFALSILAVLFPVFLGSYWSAGDSGPAVTARLSWSTAVGSIIVCVLAPVLGAISDSGGYRKRFLLWFTVLGSVSTAVLSLVDFGAWFPALSLFVLASIGYYSAAVFYDSLLVDVCEPRYYSLVSTLGLSLGYVGGAVLLTLHVGMMYRPDVFGFSETSSVIQFAFVTVGAWWLLFLIPILLFVREQKPVLAPRGTIIRSAYQELRKTFLKIKSYRNVLMFLIAYWLYIGGLFTVIFMAVNFGQRLGFSDQDLVTALMITNYVGFPATILYGYLAHRYGTRRLIYAGLVVYILVVCSAVFLTNVRQFYVMSITIGLVQGGVQGISRSMYATLIPAEHSGEFFGFYNMVTKFAHVLGPILIGIVTFFFDEPKFILVTLLPMFVIGAVLLARVDNSGSVSAGEARNG
jgi:UMF1 family MFS transporter